MKKSDAGRPVGLPHRFSSFIRRRPGTNLGRRPKTLRDLVHRERRYKVLRVIVHQVRAPRRAENSAILIELSISQTHNPIRLEK